MQTLSYFVVFGLLLGIVVPLPTFATLLIAVLFAYAFLHGESLSGAGLIFDLVLSAVAMQLGYFVAILVRLLFSKFGIKRPSERSKENDTDN